MNKISKLMTEIFEFFHNNVFVVVLCVVVMFMAACCHLTTPPEPEPVPEIKTVVKTSPSNTPPAVAAVKPLPSHMDPRFIEGFSAGVKWGITSFIRHPEKQDVNYHIFEAKKWYWLVVVDEGKTLMEAAR